MRAWELLLEYSPGGKNLHLEHLEDLIFNEGPEGVDRALSVVEAVKNILSGGDNPGQITVKWDGSPAIFAGIDPTDKKFFVGTKSVFAKTEPKLVKSPADVAKYYEGKPELGEKLLAAYKFLRNLGIENVLQGDLLFTEKDLRREEIEGEDMITFTPNTITYAVPVNSDLARKITRAKIGVVFHTTYIGGPTLQDMYAKFGVNLNNLKNSTNVWLDDATYKDYTGIVTLSDTEETYLNSEIIKAKSSSAQINERKFKEIVNNKEFLNAIKLFVNNQVRKGKHVETSKQFLKNFLIFYSDRTKSEANKLKTDAAKQSRLDKIEEKREFVREHLETLYRILDLYRHLNQIKLILINKLNTLDSVKTFIKKEGGYEVTSPEGFVAVSHNGGAVKLVNRLEFSKQNFERNR